ncbi:MAG TPA: S49 family peptidase [Parapedobacter sp.]|uniref:S49 family peptidase n=1 Tax=Parapedobacter sp. TaxID=1958893 RepID=UPI002BC38A7B|nr:S49 family peptidase [Parapedobacter sp.]HWK58120.1 S49 family peptidase [Parapedobacter sp.]
MQRILHSNWQFHLISTLLRGQFFIAPDHAVALAGSVQSIINRDWDGFNGTTDLNDEKIRSKFPISAGTVVDGFFGDLDQAPKGSTAIIPLKGTMLKYGTWCSYGTEEVAHAMRSAAVHANINSIVLDTDSGGGSVDSVAPVVQAIEFARGLGIPVVASVDMACSAAYWAASATDRIIADNGISATVGSIGVMMSFWDVKGYYEKLGYKLHTVYAPESDHKNLAFENALKEDYELLKSEELSPLAVDFQNNVKTNRRGKLNLEEPGLLNGKTFYAQKSLAVGLIDEIGTRDRAIQYAQELAIRNEFLKS